MASKASKSRNSTSISGKGSQKSLTVRNIKSQMFKLLSSKVKQKIQSDLLTGEKVKTQGNRLDLSGELKSDSVVLHTYGGESNTS